MSYQRKTKDVYEIQGNCGYGWDTETNVNYPIRITRHRERIEGNG